MRKRLLGCVLASVITLPALAALKEGDRAPEFKAHPLENTLPSERFGTANPAVCSEEPAINMYQIFIPEGERTFLKTSS